MNACLTHRISREAFRYDSMLITRLAVFGLSFLPLSIYFQVFFLSFIAFYGFLASSFAIIIRRDSWGSLRAYWYLKTAGKALQDVIDASLDRVRASVSQTGRQMRQSAFINKKHASQYDLFGELWINKRKYQQFCPCLVPQLREHHNSWLDQTLSLKRCGL